MAACTDPSITHRHGVTFNVVKLPRVGIEPLDILGRHGAIERLGCLDETWTSAGPLPPRHRSPRPVSSVRCSWVMR